MTMLLYDECIYYLIAGLLEKLFWQVGQCACAKQPAAHTHSTRERGWYSDQSLVNVLKAGIFWAEFQIFSK